MLQKLLGKATWLKLKRELTEDAKKIWIVAPIPRKYNKKVKTIEDGEEIEKIETVKYNAYRYVYVYDIAHTTGKAIPLQSEIINCDDKASFYNKLKELDRSEYTSEELKEIFSSLLKKHGLGWSNNNLNTYFPKYIKKRKQIDHKRVTIYKFIL